MRKASWRFRVPYLLAFGVLVTAATLGCTQGQDGGGDAGGDTTAAEDQAAATQMETTAEETTARMSQTTRGGGQQETTQEEQQEQTRRPDTRGGTTADGQGELGTVTVRVTGTEGLAFTGRVGSARNLRSVEDSVPQEYELPFGGSAVTATVRKQEPGPGTLEVEVIREGEVVDSRESTAATGVVNLVWTPPQQGNRGG